ncbi:hypothetical protein AaE_003557 [Aphanomyces astaci]|uniref:Uncharacterized protein n=1 Tax=Aphanomyces astaci TaxID=112090 RepID=A0A6A5AV10_APHAT|nr:hypothetical protein AaE_003557 [Aphanomyces astaci]
MQDKVTAQMVTDAITRFEVNAAKNFRHDDPDLTPRTLPVLVASNVSVDEAEMFFTSRVANLATFFQDDATGDVFVTKVSNAPANRALEGLDNGVAGYVNAYSPFLYGDVDVEMLISPSYVVFDYAIQPRLLPAGEVDAEPPRGVPTFRIVIEIEYNDRTLSELQVWATRLLGNPLIRAFVGIFVFNRYPDGTFAMLAVLFRRDADGNVVVFDAASFGTRALHPSVMSVVNEMPFAQGAALRELPLPPVVVPHEGGCLCAYIREDDGPPIPAAWSGANPSITVPGEDVFWMAPAPAMDPLPDLVIDLWRIYYKVASCRN